MFCKSPVLSLFLCMLFFNATAQFQNSIPQVKPLSPDAASLFKVLERPVGNYTGTVPISFPLMSLQSGSLSAALSLEYNSTGGIRVEEAPGCVGQGFSLSDGAGRIVQTVNGIEDDRTSGRLSNIHKPSAFGCTDMLDVLAATASPRDLEPDAFYYNFNGKSGKFLFREDGSIVLSDNAGIKIEYDTTSIPNNGIRQWIITDENGRKYYFGKSKNKAITYYTTSNYTYTSVNNSGNTKPGVSSYTWYLTEVYDMNEESSLKYSYVPSAGIMTTVSGGFWPVAPLSDLTGFNTVGDMAIVQTGVNEYQLSRIDGSSGYILLNTDTNRQDGNIWARKVNSIELYDPNGTLRKRIAFNLGYFSAVADISVRRLKLNGFTESGGAGSDSAVYKFEYNEMDNLPARGSNAVDHWGYFNNKYNPTSYPGFVYQYGGVTYRRSGIDRSAVPAYAAANILTKITFPTGGYREFVYEGNTALQITAWEYYPEEQYTQQRSFNRTDFNYYNDPLPCMQHQFSINSTDGGAMFNYTLNSGAGYCNSYHVKLFQLSYPGDTYGYQIYDLYNTPMMTWDLPNGYYRMEVYKSDDFCSMATLSGNWVESTLSKDNITTPNGSFNKNNLNVGGVRIKEIRDYDPVSNKISTTKYKYQLYSTDSAYTSGLLITPLHLITLENPGAVNGYFLALHTSSAYPLASQGGSYVVYPEVRTIEEGNGWVDRTFSFVQDGLSDAFPLVPPADNSHLRGWLLKERFYSQSGTLLKSTTYSYDVGYQGAAPGVRFKPYYQDIMDNNGTCREWPRNSNEVPYTATCNYYYATVGSYLLYSKTDSLFTPAGTFVTTTINNYDIYKDQRLLRRVQTSQSDGSIKSSTYHYPFAANTDFVWGLASAEQNMKTTLLGKNYLQPLENVDSVATTITSGGKISFSLFNVDKIHPGIYRQYNTPQGYTETNFSAYDEKGNLTEQFKTGDTKEVYLWGYNNSYPIAKVTGSTYSAVAALVTNAVIQQTNITDAAMRAELNKIRTGLAGTPALVTTYTYAPQLGMTSATDPSGKITFYEYDSNGRLKLIRDQDGNILKQLDYQYQQPVTQ
ncbi:YD repeat-containing protein [Chitinophaga sp. HK235]|uniref:YD repeat-containing protein n=1 Tax=Chitinophaga sp. HK235 TaxID=2952571 RepID=UPI001BA81ED9|nr:YD repeat-containing protein [Chitinophaga sp. HK235]